MGEDGHLFLIGGQWVTTHYAHVPDFYAVAEDASRQVPDEFGEEQPLNEEQQRELSAQYHEHRELDAAKVRAEKQFGRPDDYEQYDGGPGVDYDPRC